MERSWLWVGFSVLVLAMLALDLFVFHREAHEVRMKEAAGWSILWVLLSLAFGSGVYYVMGAERGLEFFTGYLIEKALSVDNLFVFVLIFSYFRVPFKYQHRVLFWGVLGALVLRGVLIAAGTYLIGRFHWIIYLFGAFLVFTGIRMATQDERAIEPESNPAIRLVRRFFPVTNVYHGPKFIVTEERSHEPPRRLATPLLVVLVLVETTDLIFAVDSIPAILAISQDPFIVYSSNVFAILGLRSLYFVLGGIIHRFHYLKLGLSVVLVFAGAKMLLSDVYRVPISLSLAVVALVLTAAIAASLLFPERAEAHATIEHPLRRPRLGPGIAPIEPTHRSAGGRHARRGRGSAAPRPAPRCRRRPRSGERSR